MAFRLSHPILLAGSLFAIPTLAAWSPGRDSKPTSQASRAFQLPESVNSGGTIRVPVEIAEQGKTPVQKTIEISVHAVPEPSSLLLLGPSALLLWRRRRP